ncbi:hypothetical protein L7F22_026003 [Adiantum nelumboides]|nr:hypothetical protein [Adiantum nelumboides]
MTNFLIGKGYWEYIDGDQEEMPELPDENPTANEIKAFKDWNQGARKPQRAIKRREILAIKAIQEVVKKMDQFDGKDVTKYLCKYVKEMEPHCVFEGEMIQSFELVVVPKTREHVMAIGDLHERNCEELGLALKEQFFMEKLELLLEDKYAKQGLKTSWNEVEDVVSLLAKQQKRRNNMIVNTSIPISLASNKVVKLANHEEKGPLLRPQ